MSLGVNRAEKGVTSLPIYSWQNHTYFASEQVCPDEICKLSCQESNFESPVIRKDWFVCEKCFADSMIRPCFVSVEREEHSKSVVAGSFLFF